MKNYSSSEYFKDITKTEHYFGYKDFTLDEFRQTFGENETLPKIIRSGARQDSVPKLAFNSLSLVSDLSTIKTFACKPIAIVAAFSPTTPPPKINMFTGLPPGAPPTNKPLPP